MYAGLWLYCFAISIVHPDFSRRRHFYRATITLFDTEITTFTIEALENTVEMHHSNIPRSLICKILRWKCIRRRKRSGFRGRSACVSDVTSWLTMWCTRHIVRKTNQTRNLVIRKTSNLSVIMYKLFILREVWTFFFFLQNGKRETGVTPFLVNNREGVVHFKDLQEMAVFSFWWILCWLYFRQRLLFKTSRHNNVGLQTFNLPFISVKAYIFLYFSVFYIV